MTSAVDDKGRLRGKDPLLWGGLVLGIGGLLAFVVMVRVAFVRDSQNEQLTALETTLFAILTLLLSGVGSVLVTAYFSREQAKRDYVQLARPAWRRVVQLAGSAAQISEAIVTKKSVLSAGDKVSQDRVSEWLDSFERLVRQHAGQLNDAVSDWQELLPEDYAELRAVTTLIDEMNSKVAALSASQVELASAQEQQAKDAEAAARKQISGLEEELRMLKKKLDERSSYIPLSGLKLGTPISPAGSVIVRSITNENFPRITAMGDVYPVQSKEERMRTQEGKAPKAGD